MNQKNQMNQKVKMENIEKMAVKMDEIITADVGEMVDVDVITEKMDAIKMAKKENKVQQKKMKNLLPLNMQLRFQSKMKPQKLKFLKLSKIPPSNTTTSNKFL
jgi:hypothetical protein